MMKIYLADLVYDSIKTNCVVPLNVAYIAAYVQARYPDRVDIRLFKYPRTLEDAVRTSPPDILGVSNYSWNEQIAHTFIRMAKRLNPNVVTVMGGPNIRSDVTSVEEYLKNNTALDYYIVGEGEEPFCDLVGKLLGEDSLSEEPKGCAKLSEGSLRYDPQERKGKQKEFDYPSPYLGGYLDEFLKDPELNPLFETNRGCPFGCTYCAWGSAALSKVRVRPLSTVNAEMHYVARKSVKQVYWNFCDANFGILERDLEIAKEIRKIMDENGFPIYVHLAHSKNTSGRNIEIAKVLKDRNGYIAIQSSDPVVLTAAGRGNIKMDHLKAQIEYYRNNGQEVTTDILVGLPSETAASHMQTLLDAFTLGFGMLSIYNIRLLPGTQYESMADRKGYGVKTKFRPIFGASGIYDGQKVLEVEESVRATSTMSEAELEHFKILHWLIYFCWNMGIFKPILRFAQGRGVNPGRVLAQLRDTKHPYLAKLFSRMEQHSMGEWFDSRDEFYKYYSSKEHFESLATFRKLNFLWIAEVFQDRNTINELLSEIIDIIMIENSRNEPAFTAVIEGLASLFGELFCSDLLRHEFRSHQSVAGEVAACLLDKPELAQLPHVEVEIFRESSDVAFCNHYLNSGGRPDFSLNNLSRFFENGGGGYLTNRIRLAG